MIGLLIEAAEIMDDLFWKQAYGDDYKAWLASIGVDDARRFAESNYGPWDRLDDEQAVHRRRRRRSRWVPISTRRDMTQGRVRGGLSAGQERPVLTACAAMPHGELIAGSLSRRLRDGTQGRCRVAARGGEPCREHRISRITSSCAPNALISDEFQVSDLYWMDVKDNEIDVVIGPIETYEDRLFGYRAAYEAYVLIKDLDWSAAARAIRDLPARAAGRPAGARRRTSRRRPGSDSDLNAYDVVYYAGDSNAGSKTIAINLPNDEEVQLQKGTRRLQLKNAMQAKFDKILEPIADELVDESQRKHITFDAFFANTMFHEVAHGLGIKNTIDGKGTVREALLDVASSMEEGKADVLGLYMVTELHEAGELGDVDPRGLLRDLHGQRLPLDPLWREQRARQGEHGALQLLY